MTSCTPSQKAAHIDQCLIPDTLVCGYLMQQAILHGLIQSCLCSESMPRLSVLHALFLSLPSHSPHLPTSLSTPCCLTLHTLLPHSPHLAASLSTLDELLIVPSQNMGNDPHTHTHTWLCMPARLHAGQPARSHSDCSDHGVMCTVLVLFQLVSIAPSGVSTRQCFSLGVELNYIQEDKHLLS